MVPREGTQSGLSNAAIPSVRVARRKWLCLRFLLSPHWPRTVQLSRDCSLLAVTGGAQKTSQTSHIRELVEVVEKGGKGGQKLKIVAMRAEVEDAPGTWRERWGVLRGAETEASGLGLFSLLMAHLQP